MSGVLGEVHGRDVGPGQPDQLLVQSGTVALDHEHVVRAASVQVKGMLVLGPGSGDVLLRPRPLRTVRAGHPAHGSSESLRARRVQGDAGFRANVGDPTM